MNQVSVHEARNNLSQLIKAVQAGEEVVIANRGEPVARLVRADHHNGRGIAGWLAKNRMPANQGRSPSDLDGSIAAEREGWD